MSEDRLKGVYHFIDKDGDSPVKECIHSLTLKDQAKVYAYIKELNLPGLKSRDSSPEQKSHPSPSFIPGLKPRGFLRRGLKKQGNNLRRPMADYLGDGIYELRPKDNRIFYFFYVRDKAVLVHAIKKHVQKIPPNELKLCLKRKVEVETCVIGIEKLEW